MGSAKIVVLTNLACVLSLMSCGSGRNKNQSSHSRDPLLMDLTQFESTEDQVQLSQYDECKQFQNEKDKWVIPAFKEYFISGDFRGQESKDLSTAPYVYYYGYVFANEKAPIIFYNGGPTSDSHSSFEAFSTLSDEFKKLIQNEQSFIFMDQRGTGCSDTYLNSGMESEALFLDYIRHLQNDWASSSIVADSEILRKELFGDKIKWKVYGQSYGALIAQRYIEIAPQGLSSVHAHGFAFTDYINTFVN